jgi:hypothetical protein
VDLGALGLGAVDLEAAALEAAGLGPGEVSVFMLEFGLQDSS